MNQLRLDGEEFAPSKIVCIGRNYVEHIRELGNVTPDAMMFFAKPNSAISARLRSEIDGDALLYEAEICFSLRAGQLHGMGFGLDLVRRDLQSRLKNKGLPWERARAFDGAACFSDFVALGDHPISSLRLRLDIDGRVRQQGGYELMINKPEAILAEIQTFMSLEDGDIIMTGTPRGMAAVQAGEIFTGSLLCGEIELVSIEWQAD